MRFEAGQIFYCIGHPARLFCAPVPTSELVSGPTSRLVSVPTSRLVSVLTAKRPLRSGARKSTPGSAKRALLAWCSEYLPSLFVTPAALVMLASVVAHAQDVPVRAGAAAFGDWHADAPGVRRHIGADDLPPPFASRSASNTPSVVTPEAGAVPRPPPGFTVTRFAEGFDTPRLLRVAPNGDIFLAETGAGRVRVLRATDGAAKAARNEVFASGLEIPFGIAFYPPGPAPRFVYVASLNSVVRYPWRPGEFRPSGPAEVVVPRLTDGGGGHVTRDVQFTPDGKRMLVSVGSASNDAGGMGRRTAEQVAAWDAQHGVGAAWGPETNRAAVLSFDPDGGNPSMFATGLRNCVGLAIQPRTGDAWCSTNERDGLGDNLPPDYVTRVRRGGFYGWPWYYIGAHEDPRHRGERPDLAAQATVPDVLVQPHSAPLQMTFYPPDATGPAAFPASYRGDAFVALHGSWNRALRTGYKVVRIPLRDGVPTGEYEDFLIGFVHDDDAVWGRPVGVAVAHDGALLVTEDGNGTIWRVAPTGR